MAAEFFFFVQKTVFLKKKLAKKFYLCVCVCVFYKNKKKTKNPK